MIKYGTWTRNLKRMIRKGLLLQFAVTAVLKSIAMKTARARQQAQHENETLIGIINRSSKLTKAILRLETTTTHTQNLLLHHLMKQH